MSWGLKVWLRILFLAALKNLCVRDFRQSALERFLLIILELGGADTFKPEPLR